MISIVYITNRGLYPLVSDNEKSLSQYALLGQSLMEQTLSKDRWNLVVVDQHNQVPRRELGFLGDRVKYVRPRDTPWRKIGTFCASSARNSGLSCADGDIILGLDDCVSFKSNLLDVIQEYASKGLYIAPVLCMPGEYRAIGEPKKQGQCGGIVSYPRKIALESGMHEERFDGAEAYDDIEFSIRLSRAGVEFISDGRAKVFLHRHERPRRKIVKCAFLINRLVRHGGKANTPWTDEQLGLLCNTCSFVTGRSGSKVAIPQRQLRCLITKGRCRGPALPPPEAIEVIRTYESRPWEVGGVPVVRS